MNQSRLRLTLLLLGGILAACGWAARVDAQQPNPPATTPKARRYELRYAAADEVIEQLRTSLASLRASSEIAVDKETGDIVVTGDDEAQRLAAQLVSTVDRPGRARVDLPRGGEPVLEGYAVEPARLEATASALRERFPLASGAKIAVNQRSNQLLVLATPDVQVKVWRALQQLEVGGTPAVAQRGAALAATKATKRSYDLKVLEPLALENGLAKIWGRQLPIATSDDGSVSTITFPAAGGAKVTMQLDHTARRLNISGPESAVHAWRQVVAALDAPQDNPRKQTAVMPLRWSERDKVEVALAAFQSARGVRWGGDLVNLIFQQDPPDDEEDDGDDEEEKEPPQEEEPPAEEQPPVAELPPSADAGTIGPVQVEFLEGLDVIVIRGNKRDVERVTKIIEDIERLSAETEPAVQVLELRHADNESVVTLVTPVYDQFFAPRYGRVSMTPLVKPNAILVVGRPDSVAAAADLITKVDSPVSPDSQFRVFQLKYLPVGDFEARLTTFYEERGGLGPRVRLMADYRSNSLVVQASPRDLDEIGDMLARIDVAQAQAVSELRVFKLRNSLADDLAPVIQDAIRGDNPNSAGGAQGGGGGTGTQNRQQQVRSTMLTLATIDSEGGRLLRSGILADVQVSSDARANALVVRGPPEAMDLISALIEQLDQLPSEAQIKVFTIVNGDAASLAETLDELFGIAQTQGNQPGVGLGAGQGDSSLVPLRFSVDLRTNSILASGSAADLEIVEAILLRLDEGDIRDRVTVVYRLKNSPALDVANAINEFLGSEREVQQLAQGQSTPFEQIEREVVVVPEPVSNSLIVSASPRYFKEVEAIVEKLDERPPMVLIQVLIAEVALDDTDELGVELGIQDSLLFDRSASVGGLLDPGFNFNNRPLGNADTAASRATREDLAGQALTAFGVGRSNNALGYGGLVLSAGNESLNVLIRALQDERSLQVLSRPQVMTLDNQPAFVQVGQRVPRITSSNIVNNAIINNTTLENVGILLGVTPRIAPDGQVVMEVDAEKSEVGPEAEGIPISVSENGTVIRSPRIDIITAQTTVSARSGQTVILGGLITRRTLTVTRRAPYVSDIPVVGNLFRFDSVEESRGELLFIMTPYVVRGDADIEMIKQAESFRMSWCVADVVNVHGEHGLTGAYERWRGGGPEGMGLGMGGNCGPDVIYPDAMPGAPAETIPQGVPVGPESLPTPIPIDQIPTQPPPGPTQAAPPMAAPEFVVPEAVPPAGEQSSRWFRWRREQQVQPAAYNTPQPIYARPPDVYRPQRLPQSQ